MVLARAESALLVDGKTRCRTCRQHLHFRCVCLQGDRAGAWADITMERQVSDCVHGSTSTERSLFSRLKVAELNDGKLKQLASYRQALLGTVQCMRGVNKFWRDSVSYDMIDNLRLDPANPCGGWHGCTLPDWMQELQRTELTLSSAIEGREYHDRICADVNQTLSDTLVQRQRVLETWLWSVETRLPITLQRLAIENDDLFNDTTGQLRGGRIGELPPCIRYLTNLRSLSFQESQCYPFHFDLPEWLSELPHLVSLQLNVQASHQSAAVLSSMSLECLDIKTYENGSWAPLLPALFAPDAAIRVSLRVLTFNGYSTMTELPLCLRHLQLKWTWTAR